MSIRFVATDPERGGLPVKRRQVATACAPCRKKKKRCHHQEGLEQGEQPRGLPTS
jgi:hypothetical protein